MEPEPNSDSAPESARHLRHMSSSGTSTSSATSLFSSDSGEIIPLPTAAAAEEEAGGGEATPKRERCIGRAMTWGSASIVGRRKEMEDAVVVAPLEFMAAVTCVGVGGCAAAAAEDTTAEISHVRLFGVYDGHGGSQTASGIYKVLFLEADLNMSWCCFGARKKPQEEQGGFSRVKNIRLFSYNELRSATQNFHPNNRIGRGGFGTVYKGTLRDGTPIAAKVLSAASRQGVNEFLTEIDVITNVKHTNLLELLGCCVQDINRVLVYEYLENNSLDHVLLGPRSRPSDLNWDIRSAICLGTARGLAYLHEGVEPHIVHRDIKASNILLDKNFVPKIGDFGLAKLFPDNVTHISTRVAGTSGYLAPEYAVRGQLTRKADVYSFGVLVLEVVSGRSSSKAAWSETNKYLLEWTWQLYEEKRLIELVDPELKEYPEEEVLRYIMVGLLCTQWVSVRRPTMSQVVEMLSNTITLNEKELTAPGLLHYSGKGFKLKNCDSDNKDSSTMNTTSPFTSTPVTYSEMDPR